jgi:hypothetical protein
MEQASTTLTSEQYHIDILLDEGWGNIFECD